MTSAALVGVLVANALAKDTLGTAAFVLSPVFAFCFLAFAWRPR